MASTKYVAQQPPSANTRKYLEDEFRKIQLTTDSLITLLQDVGVPIEVGPPDSAGVGYRVLRIPN